MRLLIGALAFAAGVASVTGYAQARDLTFAGWGGEVQDAMRESYFKPFTDEKKIPFQEDTYLGGLAELKAMVSAGQVKWDVMGIEQSDLIVACDEGLLEHLDWDVIGGRDIMIPNAASDCGAGYVVVSTGVAYNKDKLGSAGEPKSWADLWDVKKWPGKRGLRAGPKYNLEIALFADGVPGDQIYKVLGTPEGQDRAFRKLDEIKPYLQFWEAGAQPVEWLVSGDVVMSVSYNGRIANAVRDGKNLGFVWDNSMYAIDMWAVPAGTPHKDLAMEFIKYASTVDPQLKFGALIPYGPTNKFVADKLDPNVAGLIPAGKNLATATICDEAFWADNIEQLTKRWNSWAAQ